MGLFDWLLQRKESAFSQAIVSQYAAGQPLWTGEDFEKLAREGFKVSPYVYTCVSKISQGAAGIPLTLFEENRGRSMKGIHAHLAGLRPRERQKAIRGMLDRKDLVEVPNHVMLQRLARPNPLYGGTQLIEATIGYRLMSGNSYIEPVGPDNRPPVEIYTHRPDRMQVLTGDAREPVRGYEYRAGGSRRTVDANAIIHWKTWNPLDDYYGMSPLVAAARSVDMSNSARAWNVSLTQNSARPSGLLMVKGGKSTGASMPAFVEAVRKWVGTSNAGKPGVLMSPPDGEVSWVQTSFTPLEISWLEGLKMSAREVAMVFGYPFVLLDPDASTFANQGEGRKALYQETILPLMDNLMGEFNTKLTPRWDDRLILGYDVDGIEALQEDQEKLHARVQNDWTKGLLTLNQARAALGYDEDPTFGGLYYWQIVQMKQLAAPGSAEETPGAEPGGGKIANLVDRMRAAM